MVTFFSSQDQRSLEAKASVGGATLPPPKTAGFFDNVYGATGLGLFTSVAQVDNLLIGGAGIVARGVDAIAGTDSATFFDDWQRGMDKFIKLMEPNPQTTGTLGQIGYSVATVLPQAAANPILAAVTQGQAEKRRLVNEGVDQATAAGVGAVAGAFTFGGIVSPAAIGKRLTTRVLSGAGVNAGFGVAQRATTSQILEKSGYTEMAEQYRALDGMSVAVDAVLGGAFGALNADVMSKERIQQAEVDSALAMNSVRHMEIEAAPAIPANVETRNAHIKAMETAQQQIIRGDAVDVSKAFSKPERLAFVIKEGGSLEADYAQAIKIAQESGDTKRAESLTRELEAGMARDANRSAKLKAVENKKQKAIEESVLHSIEVDKFQAELNSSRAALEQFIAIDKESGVNLLDDINQKLQDSKIKGRQRKALESQKAEIIQGRKNLKIEENINAAKSRVAAMEKQFSFMQKRAAQIENKIKRYDAEAQKRAEKNMNTIRTQAIQDTFEESESLMMSGVFPSLLSASGNESVFEPVRYQDANPPSATDKLAATDVSRFSESGSIDVVLKDILDAEPEMDVPIVGDDGDVIGVAKLSDALAKADDEIKKAGEFSKLFDVAVTCFIRNGR